MKGLILMLLLALAATANAGPVELPEMGSSSGAAISPRQEDQIGREMLRRLRRAGKILDDKSLESYVADLGARLTSGLDAHFTFFVVDDPSINAFAMPGGFVGVNSGLIRATRNEDELAAVLAHEIAHVSQHHLARSFEKANEMNLPATAAVIAAIILGAQDPELGQAAIATSMASSSQAQLDFTRANEKEADRVGIGLLAAAGFDPSGMPSFFQRLERDTRYYDHGLPEFLSTHPVTSARIADSRARAAQMHWKKVKRDSTRYRLLRARLDVQQNRDPQSLVKELRDELRTGRSRDKSATRFAYALALARVGRDTDALQELEKLKKADPTRILYLQARAQIEEQAGHPGMAVKTYRRALELYPLNPVLSLDLAQTLLAEQKPRQARDLLREYTRNHTQDEQGFQLLAQAETELNHQGAAHLAQAEYYVLTDEVPLAIDQLQTAQRLPSLDEYHTARIQARLRELKEQEATTKKKEQ